MEFHYAKLPFQLETNIIAIILSLSFWLSELFIPESPYFNLDFALLPEQKNPYSDENLLFL